jgi:diguanylate cyclase (GGDEF)-like protein/PAS domain S-box-containing protein
MGDPVSHDVHYETSVKNLEDLRAELLRISMQEDSDDALFAVRQFEAHALIDQFPDFIYVKDRRSRFVLANASTARANNLSAPSQLLGKTDFDLFDADAAEKLFVAEQAVMSSGEPMVDLEHCLSFAGKPLWLQSTKTPLRDADGRIVGLIGVSRDVTERKRKTDLLLGHAKLLEMIARGRPLEHVLLALVDLVEDELQDVIGSILLLDEGSDRLRHGATSSLPASYVRLIEGHRIGPSVASCGTAAWRRKPVIVSDVLVDPLWENYRELPLRFGFRSCWSTPIMGPEDTVLGTFALYSNTVREPTPLELELMAMATDLAGIAIERARNEARIQYMAHHDPLTGLPNRTLFLDQFNRTLAEAVRERRSVTVAYVDLDNFKQINDTFGHAAGDEVLKTLSGRLARSIRACDLLVRLGGDEFAIVFSNSSRDEGGVLRRLEGLRGVICSPVEIGGKAVQVTCSMGIAFFPGDGETPEALLARADRAMYDAKNDGRNCLQVSEGRTERRG